MFITMSDTYSIYMLPPLPPASLSLSSLSHGLLQWPWSVGRVPYSLFSTSQSCPIKMLVRSCHSYAELSSVFPFFSEQTPKSMDCRALPDLSLWPPPHTPTHTSIILPSLSGLKPHWFRCSSHIPCTLLAQDLCTYSVSSHFLSCPRGQLPHIRITFSVYFP